MRVFIYVVCAALALGAAAPPVSNRAPAVSDIGYLPADGSTAGTNPPALAWLPEPEAEAYAVQLARDKGFTSGVLTVLRTPYVLYTHTATLAAGAWWWRYACLDGQGNRSAWSQARRFTIAPDAKAFPRPGEDVVRQRMPKAHPRLVPAGSVYFLKFEGNPTQAEIEKFIAAAWLQPVSDDEQSRNDGFGLALLGAWDGGLYEMEVKP